MTEVTVQVVVPARNEEACIGRCLQSLVSQQGISFSVTVVDDGSTDRTRSIAESLPGVRVISAPEPAEGVSGKCNALVAGTQGASAEWLLFTDADTFHYPGSLSAAVDEATERGADLLSYSPEQETGSWYERMLMPLVYAELTRTYQTDRINDRRDPAVAANGQYILVRRAVYEALGGHHSVAGKLLEDVELARLFKASDHKIWFRFGGGRVRTRMYRSFQSMCEGWTKNLAILFPHPLRLAAVRLVEFLAILSFAVLWIVFLVRASRMAETDAFFLALLFYLLFLIRIRRAHFGWDANLMAFWGLPLFSSLLLRSWLHWKVRGAVTWKGRIYSKPAPKGAADSSIQESEAK